MFQLLKQMKQLKTAQKELNQANQQLVDLSFAIFKPSAQ
jgi:hypothetical protein